MTLEEFSNQFDVLLDSYRRAKLFDEKEELDSIEFNEYEKSVFLTNAQEQIVVELYTGRNIKGAAFETTEELRSNLKGLIRTAEIDTPAESIGITPDSVFFNLPEDCLFITYEHIKIGDESAGCYNGRILPVIPVAQDDFHRIRNNPFRGANKRRALRLDAGERTVEIVSYFKVGSYLVRYLSRPKPIVLRDFSEVSIQGISIATPCVLDEIIHNTILERAVLLALQSKNIYMGSSKEK